MGLQVQRGDDSVAACDLFCMVSAAGGARSLKKKLSLAWWPTPGLSSFYFFFACALSRRLVGAPVQPRDLFSAVLWLGQMCPILFGFFLGLYAGGRVCPLLFQKSPIAHRHRPGASLGRSLFAQCRLSRQAIKKNVRTTGAPASDDATAAARPHGPALLQE